jgi:hypothetical protein
MISETNEVTTPAELLDSGRAYVEKVEHFANRKNPAYFVSLYSTGSGWEISEFAYNSRIHQSYMQQKEIREIVTDPEITTPYIFQNVTYEIKSYRSKYGKYSNWVADVYLNGELWYEGDHMFYSGEEAISDIKNNFAFYASDMFTS